VTQIYQYAIRRFTKLLAPFAPHISEEIYNQYGDKDSIFLEKWPEHDQEALKEERFTLVVQVDGSVRAKIEAAKGIKKEIAKELALSHENVKKFVKNTPRKVVYIPDKLINLVN